MPPTSGARRLDDLLIDPRETLDVELKGWLDITGNADHKATLAKSLIALANHGGGYVLIGFEQAAAGSAPSPGRPGSLAAYNPDTVNAIVAAYAEPVFHCDVAIGSAPDGLQYPIVAVPGGHRVPVRAKRDGPNGQIVKQYSYYIRRPGPQSEIPKSGQEWDDLMRRCISNGREDLIDQFRTIMAGGPATAPQPSDEEQLQKWFEASSARWGEILKQTPAGSSARMPLGHFAAAYRLRGAFERPSLADLKDILNRATVRHTGWPAFWVPTRQGISPYIHDNALECWLARDEYNSDAAHADFWRVSPNGDAFLIRGLQEDSADNTRSVPGKGFDLTIPTWRVGEVLLHAENMARELGDPQAEVTAQFEWAGLAGRELVVLSANRWVLPGHRTQQDTYSTTLTVQADQISNGLPELVDKVVRPLAELFDFFRLPPDLTTGELTNMRNNRY